jgi:hypothetical protein
MIDTDEIYINDTYIRPNYCHTLVDGFFKTCHYSCWSQNLFLQKIVPNFALVFLDLIYAEQAFL